MMLVLLAYYHILQGAIGFTQENTDNLTQRKFKSLKKPGLNIPKQYEFLRQKNCRRVKERLLKMR